MVRIPKVKDSLLRTRDPDVARRLLSFRHVPLIHRLPRLIASFLVRGRASGREKCLRPDEIIPRARVSPCITHLIDERIEYRTPSREYDISSKQGSAKERRAKYRSCGTRIIGDIYIYIDTKPPFNSITFQMNVWRS